MGHERQTEVKSGQEGGLTQWSAFGTFSTAGSMPGNMGILWEWLTGVLSTLGGSSSDSSLLGDFSSIKRQTLSHWWLLTALHKNQGTPGPSVLGRSFPLPVLQTLPGNSGHEQTASSREGIGRPLAPATLEDILDRGRTSGRGMSHQQGAMWNASGSLQGTAQVGGCARDFLVTGSGNEFLASQELGIGGVQHVLWSPSAGGHGHAQKGQP